MTIKCCIIGFSDTAQTYTTKCLTLDFYDMAQTLCFTLDFYDTAQNLSYSRLKFSKQCQENVSVYVSMTWLKLLRHCDNKMSYHRPVKMALTFKAMTSEMSYRFL